MSKTYYQELFEDPDYCLAELRKAKMNIQTCNNLDSWRALEKFLGLMFIYCDKDLEIIVYSLLHEMTCREKIKFDI